MPEQHAAAGGTYNPYWDTETPTRGFARDYTGEIRTVEFKAGQYNFQAVVVTTLDEPVVGNDGKLRNEATEFYSIGGLDTWESRDGGDSFVGKKDENAKVRSNTDFGRVIDRVRDLYATAGRLSELGDPRIMETWRGMRLHMVSESIEVPAFTDRDKVKHEASTKLLTLPSELLDGAPAPAKQFDLDALALPPDVLARLQDVAAGSETKEQFQAAVMPLLKEFPASHQSQLIQALSDDGFRTALGGQF